MARLGSISSSANLKLWLLGLVLFIPLLTQPLAFAQNNRVVTIHVDNQTVSFPTDALTVKDALNRANVQLADHDLVEPELAAPIITDTFNINVFRARPVVIVDGDQRLTTTSAYQSPKLIAEQAGLTIYPEDNFILERITDFVGESTLGLKLTVVRATRLKLSLYGTVKTIRSQATTVGELLDQHGLVPAQDDLVRPKLDGKITPDMTVYLVRVSGDQVVEEETVPFSVREIRDKSLPLGYEEIKTPGQNGSQLVTYQITYENGHEVSRKVLSKVVVTQPIEQVSIVGDKYDLAEAFAQLRQCEAGGAYDRNSGNGYYGAYQFNVGTWQSNAPSQWKNVLPSEAPPSAQDRAAFTLYSGRGWSPWPACTKSLGLR